MLASNSLGVVDEEVLDERLHVILNMLKSNSQAGLPLAGHSEAGVEAVEGFWAKISASTCSNGSVEGKSAVGSTVVVVGQEGGAAVLTKNGQGLPDVDIIGVDGAARDSSVGLFVEHTRRVILKKMTLDSQLLVLQFLALLDN